ESPLARAARASLSELSRPLLTLRAPASQAPGEKAALEIEARNVGSIRCRARRLRLDEAMRDSEASSLQGLTARPDATEGLRKFCEKDSVSWEAVLAPRIGSGAGRFQWSQTPLTRAGAYLVEAEADGTRSAAVLVIP